MCVFPDCGVAASGINEGPKKANNDQKTLNIYWPKQVKLLLVYYWQDLPTMPRVTIPQRNQIVRKQSGD